VPNTPDGEELGSLTGQSGRLGLSPSGVPAATYYDDGLCKWEGQGDITQVTSMSGSSHRKYHRAHPLPALVSTGKG